MRAKRAMKITVEPITKEIPKEINLGKASPGLYQSASKYNDTNYYLVVEGRYVCLNEGLKSYDQRDKGLIDVVPVEIPIVITINPMV